MYKAELTVQNPITGETRAIQFQFDPAAITSEKWSVVYTRFEAKVQEMLISSLTTEPEKI